MCCLLRIINKCMWCCRSERRRRLDRGSMAQAMIATIIIVIILCDFCCHHQIDGIPQLKLDEALMHDRLTYNACRI